jgi:hypothetical protein
MSKAELLDLVETEHAAWEAVLSELDESDMTVQGVVGVWSVKDILAHIAWFEREMVGMLRAHALVGSDLWQLSADQRNAVIFEEVRHRPLERVLAEAEEVFQQLQDALQTLTEEDLVNPGRFPGMPVEWQPWKVIAGNTYEHYRHHGQDVRAWLAKFE